VWRWCCGCWCCRTHMYSNYGDLWEAVQTMIRDYGAEKGIHSAISTIGEW